MVPTPRAIAFKLGFPRSQTPFGNAIVPAIPLLCLLLIVPASAQSSTSSAQAPVIVHEWGTFTSLQDEHGNAIGGINVDDEPVPSFVYGVGGAPIISQYSRDQGNFGLPPYSLNKGWIAGDPAITMRLETPVLYIYPPKGQTPQSVPPLKVHVDFHGGVLSQFYPYADVTGLPLYQGMRGQPYFKDGLTAQTATGLTWNDVRLGSTIQPIATDDKVWTTPREVSAPLLSAITQNMFGGGDTPVRPDRETERFLFYRGIGHLDSPLRVPESFSHTFILKTPESPVISTAGWLVDIRPQGRCAFWAAQKIGPEFGNEYLAPATAPGFSSNDYSAGNLAALKSSMQAALVKEGLYPDEASAMLRTWELSYFKSPGLRFFYIVPRKWVDDVLPLKVTGARTQITRVMIGRIELITDAQRAALERLAAGPCPNLPALKKEAQDALEKSKLPPDQIAAFYSGEKPLTDLGIPIPPLIADYLSLGRFRDALIVHENQEHTTPALAQFIQQNQLAPGIR